MLFFAFLSLHSNLSAQCPANIDFENGNFTGWKFYTGTVFVDPVTDVNTLSLTQVPAAVPGRHELLNADPGNGLDEYGDFPKNCPNGSRYSVKLGNNIGGNEAEAISYEFTIPVTASKFSIIYNYAVVIQDPGHAPDEQPRLVIEVLNVTNNVKINCPSFAFVPGGGLPGFLLSTKPSNSPVYYKPWSSNTINLDGNQGKTIRISFKTADCTFVAHFGYAYVDVTGICGDNYLEAAICPQDTAVNFTAPYGYSGYTWYNSDYTQTLSTNRVLHLAPPPLPGIEFHVRLNPYTGYGCVDTLKARTRDVSNITADAGSDKVSCNNSQVQLGVMPILGLIYSWSPGTGLSDSTIANPTVSNITGTISYELTVQTEAGGCLTKDTVIVKSDVLLNTIELLGDTAYCEGSGSSAVLKVNAADSIQWYRDDIAITGAQQTQYTVTETGAYKATLFSLGGCILTTEIKNIIVYPAPQADFTVNNATHCLLGAPFSFTNNSTLSSGAMQYNWEMGNGTSFAARDITYSYPQPGTYTVKLTVKADGSCIDSKSMVLTVLPNAIADFSITPTCINLDLPIINTTSYGGSSPVNYLWDFGNNQISTAAIPVHNYATPGTYPVKLTVSTPQCPQPSTKQINLVIDSPLPGITYPVKYAMINYPLQLEARMIGNQFLWTPSTGLNYPFSSKPVFKGFGEQLYSIRITSASGCVSTDMQLIKTVKKIKIHVPTVFTPDGDGNNDYLKPLLYGFRKVNYFRIYNRWGKMLFQMESDQPGWDGRFNNNPQEMQTVVWMISAEDVDGKTHQEKGTTILIP